MGTPGKVNRSVLSSYYQNAGQVYDDTKTEGAFETVAQQVDDNWDYLKTLENSGKIVEMGIINVKDKAYGAKGDGVTNDSAAFQNLVNAVPTNTVVILPRGNYLLRSTIQNLSKKITFLGQKGTRIFSDQPLSRLFYTESEVIFKDIEFDGMNTCLVGVDSYDWQPQFYNCIIHDFVKWGVRPTATKETSPGVYVNASHGEFWAERCVFYDCEINLYLHGLRTDTHATLKDCTSYHSSDYTPSALKLFAYYFSGFKRVSVLGGEYYGDYDLTETSTTECDHVLLQDGYYHDMLRGPTVGLNSKQYIISNNIIDTVKDIGISADTELETPPNTPPEDYGLIEGNIIKNVEGFGIRTTGSRVSILSNRMEDCRHVQGAMYFYLGSNISVGNNTVFSSSVSGRLFTADNADVMIVSPNYLVGSTVSNTAITANGGTFLSGQYQYINASGGYVQNTADVVFVDAIATAVLTVYLPPIANLNHLGKRWSFLKDASLNVVNIITSDGTLIGDNLSAQLTRPNQCLELMMGNGKYHIVNGDNYLYNTAPPSSGTWIIGDRVYNSNPTPGGYLGWVCTATGTPGTWKGFGLIAT